MQKKLYQQMDNLYLRYTFVSPVRIVRFRTRLLLFKVGLRLFCHRYYMPLLLCRSCNRKCSVSVLHLYHSIFHTARSMENTLWHHPFISDILFSVGTHRRSALLPCRLLYNHIFPVLILFDIFIPHITAQFILFSRTDNIR